jgi:transmembrane sensor
MGTPPPSGTPSTLANQADHWLSVLRSGRATEQDHAAFRAWRDADPANLQAWQNRVARIDRTGFEPFHAAVGAAQSAVAPARSRRRFLAATAAACAVAGTAAYASNQVYPWRNLLSDASTGFSERRRYTLSDGSHLLLDARSAINLKFTPYLRQLTLHSGAVMVSAPEESRPFLTVTDEGQIRSSGARFMVRKHPFRTLVVAQDKPIHVETQAGRRTMLEPGMGLRFDSERLGEPSRELATRAAWEHGRIVAQGVTLSEVIEAIRPYYLGALRITTSAGGLPVFGEYSLDDVEATLHALANALPIALQRYTPWLTSISVSTS